MNLKPAHLAKLSDAATRRTFEGSDDGTPLRVIVTLKVKDDAGVPRTSQSPPETRREMRKRLIDGRTLAYQDAKTVIRALQNQDLEVKGPDKPRLTRSLVVNGLAGNILNGIELPGVARVQIDQPLRVTRVRGDS